MPVPQPLSMRWFRIGAGQTRTRRLLSLAVLLEPFVDLATWQTGPDHGDDVAPDKDESHDGDDSGDSDEYWRHGSTS